MIVHLCALTIALCLDRFIGDPPAWPHPVRWIGSFIVWIEKRMNRGAGRKARGTVACLIVVLTAGAAAWGLTAGAWLIHPAAGFAIEVLLITSALASKSLADAAEEVSVPLKQGDLDDARLKLSWIVGRDTESLQEADIARGTIETVAENTSDGVTAPMFWALIAGAPGIWMYKAINTGDSIVGYRNERYREYGFFSAKLDDAANYIPARLTGLLMLFTKKSRQSKRTLFRQLRTEARNHPSPNSGWGEAAVALLLSIQLGGQNTYKGIVSNRPLIGSPGEDLTVSHIDQTVRIMQRTTWLFLAACWIGGMIIHVSFPWS